MAVPETKVVNAIIRISGNRTHESTSVPAAEQGFVRAAGKLQGQDRANDMDADKRDNRSFYFLVISFALLAMLILLLTLQATLCCDTVTSADLPAPLPTVQMQPANQGPAPYDVAVAAASASIAAARPDPVETEDTITTNGTPVPAKVAVTATVPTAPVTADPVLARPAPAVITLASAPVAEAPGGEAIKSAAASLVAASPSGFVKLANSGELLEDDASSWECVQDRNSKLTWEVKKNDGGIRDRDNSYSWLREINGETDGTNNGGRCRGGVDCDTSSYARAINSQGLCGFSDWRLPTKDELETLVDYNNDPKQATINMSYFPEAIPSWYWTASENPQREGYAWYVLFKNGIALNDLKERPKHIRLVRGNTEQ